MFDAFWCGSYGARRKYRSSPAAAGAFLGAPCKDTLFFGLCLRNAGASGVARAEWLRLSGSAVRAVGSFYRGDTGLSGRPNAPVASGCGPSGGCGRFSGFPGLRGFHRFRDDSGICYLCFDMYSYAKALADQTL